MIHRSQVAKDYLREIFVSDRRARAGAFGWALNQSVVFPKAVVKFVMLVSGVTFVC